MFFADCSQGGIRIHLPTVFGERGENNGGR